MEEASRSKGNEFSGVQRDFEDSEYWTWRGNFRIEVGTRAFKWTYAFPNDKTGDGLSLFWGRCNAWRLKPSEEPQFSRFCTTFSMELLWDIESARVRPELLVKGSGPGA